MKDERAVAGVLDLKKLNERCHHIRALVNLTTARNYP